MKFATKEALVIDDLSDTGNIEENRVVAYIDTDSEKIAFVDWFIMKLKSFDSARDIFIINISKFLDGSGVLYFECIDDKVYEFGQYECLFPFDTPADKLALFHLIITGELDFQIRSFDLRLHRYKARVAMDTERATEVLTTNLPVELAEKIVTVAVSKDVV